MRSKKPVSAGKPTFAIFLTLLLVSAIVPTRLQARKFKVLHTFHGRDGANPVAATPALFSTRTCPPAVRRAAGLGHNN